MSSLHQLGLKIAPLLVPTPHELLSARAAILDVLSDAGSHHETDLFSAASISAGLRGGGANQSLVIVGNAADQVDRSDPQLASRRLRVAVRNALAELVRDGDVVAVSGSASGPASESITLEHVSGSMRSVGSVQIPVERESLRNGGSDCRWKLASRPEGPRAQLARMDLAGGLEQLLGPRGLEVLEEAVRCFHRGRFLAAVDLLAAASEAAWFGVAAAASGADSKLDGLVARGEMVADVIERTTSVMSTKRVLAGATRNDLRAQAARFRDLRNYGLHPVGHRDQGREAAFTESGAAVLFMTARRYFQQLDEARIELAVVQL